MNDFTYNTDPLYDISRRILTTESKAQLLGDEDMKEETFEPGQKVKVVGPVVGKGSHGIVDSGGDKFIVVDIKGKGKKSFHASDLKLMREEEEGEDETVSESLIKNRDFIKYDTALRQLDGIGNPNSPLAKSLVALLGRSVLDDLKKISKHLDEAFQIWETEIGMGIMNNESYTSKKEGVRLMGEDVATIEKIVSTLKVGDNTNFGKVVEIGKDSITFKAKDLPKTKILFKQYKMGSRDLVLDKLTKM
jgi:hypothetical protein